MDKALRLHNTAVAVARQARIAQIHDATTPEEGRLRKNSAVPGAPSNRFPDDARENGGTAGQTLQERSFSQLADSDVR